MINKLVRPSWFAVNLLSDVASADFVHREYRLINQRLCRRIPSICENLRLIYTRITNADMCLDPCMGKYVHLHHLLFHVRAT